MIKRGEKSLRLARAAATRRRQARLKTNRICVHTTGNHVYVQIISPQYKVLFSASTVEKEMREKIKNGGNIAAAQAVGGRLAEKAKDAVFEKLAFDRGGRKYHGRVRALAQAAREGGLKF
ncbi:MAG: 50S ribosomal protein L18 [Candidatus Zeuxoniibacter abyssi]|nr:MAG: 50S ribosomal protein L18 [Candidatus Persebacteraceae bacterium AB1(2)]